MGLLEVSQKIKDRFLKKYRKAQNAYVNQYLTKSPLNCFHLGRELGGKLYNCKIGACGNTQEKAAQCWDEKARVCPLFKYKKDLEQLEDEFVALPREVLFLRWPSLGELAIIQDWIQQELDKETPKNEVLHRDEPVNDGN